MLKDKETSLALVTKFDERLKELCKELNISFIGLGVVNEHFIDEDGKSKATGFNFGFQKKESWIANHLVKYLSGFVDYVKENTMEQLKLDALHELLDLFKKYDE